MLGNPGNRPAVPLTYDQFRYAFANAVSERGRGAVRTYAVPAPGEPIFQAAAANLNPWTKVKVDTKNPERGPLLIISGEKDHTVPWAIANASYKSRGGTRGGHRDREDPRTRTLATIDRGWKDVAEAALEFVRRFVK